MELIGFCMIIIFPSKRTECKLISSDEKITVVGGWGWRIQYVFAYQIN